MHSTARLPERSDTGLPPASQAGVRRARPVLALAAGSAALALIAPPGAAALAAVAAAATLLLLMAFVWLLEWQRDRTARRTGGTLVDRIANDPQPHTITDVEGSVICANAAARRRFSPVVGAQLSTALGGVFGNPAGTLLRLSDQLARTGSATEDIATRKGLVRVSVHRSGDNRLIWRLEDLPAPGHAGRAAEHLPVAMITVGRTGAVLFMNDAARTLAGGRAKTLADLFAVMPLRPGEINRIRGADGPAEVLVTERQGTAGRRELFLVPSPVGASLEAPGDIASLPVPVLKLDESGRVLSFNRHARDLLTGQVAAGDRLGDLMQGLGRPVADWLTDIWDGRQVNHTEFLRLTRPEREVFVQATLSRVTEEGKACLVAVLHDATELKTLEAQFVQTQKMQAIGQLAGGVAHDFNNLLTAISGHCDLLLLRHDQGDQDYADLIQIRQNANRAAALVSQLLAFSRKQTLQPEVLDLRDTLSDLAHLLNRLVGEKVTLTLIHDPVQQTIRADKRQLEQVIMNLVVNARDAMPAGGEIRIETQGVALHEPLRRDRARVPPGDYVLVRVSDQGTGIDADRLPKVFEPFYTTKRTGEGTGLGLSTVYGIVKQTGGFIFVDSTPGSGTIFSLYLPVHRAVEADLQPAAPTPVKALPKRGDGVVLLVEDEAPVRAFAARALRLRGYTVLEAESAEEALDLLSDPGVLVDVFVTDVIMPGLDGPTWVRRALEDRPDVRVVFVSGYAEGAFGDRGPEIANAAFLPKPFSLNQLTDTVHQQLH